MTKDPYRRIARIKDDAFDAAIMSMTLHEMHATIRPAVLKECSRVLKKSGRILY